MQPGRYEGVSKYQSNNTVVSLFLRFVVTILFILYKIIEYYIGRGAPRTRFSSGFYPKITASRGISDACALPRFGFLVDDGNKMNGLLDLNLNLNAISWKRDGM